MNASNHRSLIFKISTCLIVLVIIACSSTVGGQSDSDNEQQQETVELSIVDDNATPETKALYSRLWALQSKGVMFGHHDDLIYGRNWINEPGRSDIKDVTGDYPAVFSVDVGPIMDDRHDSDTLNDDRRRTMLEARERGQVIIANAHTNNPLTGGDSWDNSDDTVVRKILDKDSEVNAKYESWLDTLAQFFNNLKDEQGNLVPIIFRPYHEHDETWSWWGQKCTTQEEFINLWKFTIEYLQDKKDVHNLIYAISPQLDSQSRTDDLLFRWPGDDYVDFIGMDSYHGTNAEALAANLENLEALGKEKKKPVGVTETGTEGIQNDGQPLDQYWTNQILTPIVGREISMVVMWRNKYDPTHEGHHYFAPFEGHSSAPNFRTFYDASITLFHSDLPDMYSMADSVTIQ